MSRDEVIARFEQVSFEYGHNKPILDEVDFSIRRGTKLTLMGQNGAGKSTIFGLIEAAAASAAKNDKGIKPNKAFIPESGKVILANGLTIAIGRQVVPRDELDLTVREFFQKCFKHPVYDIDPKIDAVLEVVGLVAPHTRIIKSFSGGQQARLLLAAALIQDPDLLLLDEPTNNLDKAGIAHLTKFLIEYPKTVMVISHDADFLNAFTHGVLYLDVFTRKIEQYVGDYFDVIEQIKVRLEKENSKNARLAKEIQEKKDKANSFANKGGQMRLVAKKMRDLAEELEESKVDVRREDKAIRPFRIEARIETSGEILQINSYSVIKNHKATERVCSIALRRNRHLLLEGPNGIGKSTLLESLANGKSKGAVIAPGVTVGYYRQDFSTLNFNDTVKESLWNVFEYVEGGKSKEEQMRSVASGFLINGDMINTKIGSLSEGQKGLVAFARLVLQKPALLILDEPTNHINFRHLPIIAEALNKYEGAMILVSHVPEFVAKIRMDDVLNLGK